MTWPGRRPNGALVLEAVTVFVSPLATGVSAIQAGAARSAGDEEFGRTMNMRDASDGVGLYEACARSTPGVSYGARGGVPLALRSVRSRASSPGDDHTTDPACPSLRPS